MCPKRESFCIRKEFRGGGVLVKNNALCKTIGVGNVKIKMFDGVVQTLVNMRRFGATEEPLLFWRVGHYQMQVFWPRQFIKNSKGNLVVIKGVFMSCIKGSC